MSAAFPNIRAYELRAGRLVEVESPVDAFSPEGSHLEPLEAALDRHRIVVVALVGQEGHVALVDAEGVHWTVLWPEVELDPELAITFSTKSHRLIADALAKAWSVPVERVLDRRTGGPTIHPNAQLVHDEDAWSRVLDVVRQEMPERDGPLGWVSLQRRCRWRHLGTDGAVFDGRWVPPPDDEDGSLAVLASVFRGMPVDVLFERLLLGDVFGLDVAPGAPDRASPASS